MNQDELRRLVVGAVNDALDDRDRIDAATHHADHAWIELQRQRERKWNEMIEKVRLTVIGAITVAVLGALFKGLAFIGALVMAAMSAKTGGGANG